MPLPLVALSLTFGVMLVDGGTSAPALVSSLAILLIAFVWTFRLNFTPSMAGALLAAFLVLTFLTTVPLPDSLLRIAGPEASSHHETARRTLVEAQERGLIEKSGWFQISRNRAGTMRAILLLATAMAGAALTRTLSERRRVALLLGISLVLSLIGLAGLASIHLFPQEKAFWWLVPVPHGRPVACFVNRNHFGGSMAVMAAVMLGLACRTLKEKRTIGLLSSAAFVVLTIAAIGSLSRGAVLSLSCGIAAAALLNLRRRPALVVLLLLLCGGAAAAVLSLADRDDTVKSRLSSLSRPLETQSAQLRLDTWKDSMPIAKSYRVFGTGLNAFRAVYPQHRVSTARKEPHNVENEFIQIPVETGLSGTALILAALFMLLKPMASTEGRTSLLTVVLPGLVVIGAHAFVDFAVRVPVYALLAAVLVGLCISDTHLVRGRWLKVAALLSLLGPALIVMLLSCVYPRKTFSVDSRSAMNTASPEMLVEAIESSPSQWRAYYNLGRTAAYRPELRDLAEKNITTASELSPLNYRLLIELALLRLDMGDRKGATDAYSRAKKIRNWLNIRPLEALLRQESTAAP